MGVAMDNLKKAGHDAWRDDSTWTLPEGHQYLAFIGQWVRTRHIDGATVETHYLLAVDRRELVHVWYTRKVAHLHGDYEILVKPTPSSLDAFTNPDGRSQPALDYLHKHKYERLY